MSFAQLKAPRGFPQSPPGSDFFPSETAKAHKTESDTVTLPLYSLHSSLCTSHGWIGEAISCEAMLSSRAVPVYMCKTLLESGL